MPFEVPQAPQRPRDDKRDGGWNKGAKKSAGDWKKMKKKRPGQGTVRKPRKPRV